MNYYAMYCEYACTYTTIHDAKYMMVELKPKICGDYEFDMPAKNAVKHGSGIIYDKRHRDIVNQMIAYKDEDLKLISTNVSLIFPSNNMLYGSYTITSSNDIKSVYTIYKNTYNRIWLQCTNIYNLKCKHIIRENTYMSNKMLIHIRYCSKCSVECSGKAIEYMCNDEPKNLFMLNKQQGYSRATIKSDNVKALNQIYLTSNCPIKCYYSNCNYTLLMQFKEQKISYNLLKSLIKHINYIELVIFKNNVIYTLVYDSANKINTLSIDSVYATKSAVIKFPKEIFGIIFACKTKVSVTLNDIISIMFEVNEN